MKYCQYCGTQLPDHATFCLKCGKHTTQKSVSNQQDLIDKLSSRLKTNGIIWAAIATVQIVMGLYGKWNVLFIGILNIISAITSIKNSQRVLSNQNSIVMTYEPIAIPIITLVYNLFVGGVIGVLGSIYYLIFVRGFIMENKSRFLAMETTNPTYNNFNAPNSNQIHTVIVLTKYEANNGVQKEIYVSQIQKTLKVCVPKNIKDGQTLALRNVKGINQNGVTIKKDIYIKIDIQ